MRTIASRRQIDAPPAFPGLLLLVLVLWAAAPVFAQEEKPKHEAELKTVRGAVVDASENPLGSAVVYLKNLKTLAVKSSFSEDDGTYRFSGLDPNVDYQVHAEHGDLTSQTRTISSLDSRKDIVIALKVNKKKSSK